MASKDVDCFTCPTSLDSIDWSTCPTSGQPVEVTLTTSLFSIRSVNSKDGLMDVTIQFIWCWTDPRLVYKLDRVLPKNLWRPCFRFNNSSDPLFAVDRSQDADKDIIMNDEAWKTGAISWWTQFQGTVEIRMCLKSFPFDDNSLDFRLNGTVLRDGRQVRSNELILRAGYPLITFEFDNDMAEYEILGYSSVEYINTWNVSSITFGILIRRKPWYYFVNVVLLMWLILGFAFTSFFLPVTNLEGRLNILATMFLASAATLYVLDADLPKTPDGTILDRLVIVSLIAQFTMTIVSCSFSYMIDNDKMDISVAMAVDEQACIGLVAFYSIFNIYLFAQPAYRRFVVHNKIPLPNALRPERKFIPYKDCVFNDPWGAGFDSKILSNNGELE